MPIVVAGLSKSYGPDTVLAGFDLQVENESFTVITGPPKSGKSVLFRLLVGLEKADAGSILLHGEEIVDQPAAKRRIGYVPQSFALYPHLSVYDNIAYPLHLAKADKQDIKKRVHQAADMLSITHLLGKTPDLLSGGEKQRTALARGLLKDAKVFVLDDPLIGLDYKLRERLMDDLKGLRKEIGATFVYGTSDSLEALQLASKIVVIDGGKVMQASDPATAYCQPSNIRSMKLIGFPRANLLPGTVADGKVNAGPLSFASTVSGTHDVTVGIRPEALRLVAPAVASVMATVRLVEDLGGEMVIYADAQGLDLTLAFAVGEVETPSLGAEIGIQVVVEEVKLFSAADGMALPVN